MRAENLCSYREHKERLSKAAKNLKFKKAIESIEEEIDQESNKVSLEGGRGGGGVVAEWLGPRTCVPRVPGSNPGRGGCALGQGTLSSLSSLSEET